MRITIVSGARPNFMKIAPICRAIDAAREAGKNISYRDVYKRQVIYHIATIKLLSDEIFQFILQLLARKEDAAFHRSERKAEAFGNLAVLETGHMHGERDFIVCLLYTSRGV